MPRIEPITVIANPWHALDNEGRPAASIPFLGTDSVIGGTLNIERSKRARASVFDFREEAVTLRPSSPRELAFYLRQIQDGALLAADEPTANRAAVAFREPLGALADARARALAAYEEQAGHPPEEEEPESDGPPTIQPTSEDYLDRATTPAPSPGFVPPSDDSRSSR